MHVVGPPPQVVHPHLDLAPRDRLAQQRLAQRGEVVGKDRDDVDSQAAHSSNSPSGGSMTTVPPRYVDRGHDGRDEGHQTLTTLDLDDEVVGSRGMDDVADRAEPAPVDRSPPRARSGRCRRSRPDRRDRDDRDARMNNSVPRSASASPRSSTPSNRTTSRLPCQREETTTSGPAAAGSATSSEPAAKRSSG